MLVVFVVVGFIVGELFMGIVVVLLNSSVG